MVDIHNHLLYGVDDGSKTLIESISVLDDMKKYGYDKVILTPHYINNSKYNSSVKYNLELLNNMQKALDEQGIDIKLYLGNEIYIDNYIYEYLMQEKICSLNNSDYLLVELPLSGEFDEYKEIFRDLINKGYHVILAHPERYSSFQKDFSKIYELEKIGVYFQCNLDSIIGGYGEEAEKMVKRLLKEKKVAFLATDIHHKKYDYTKWVRAKLIALKYISEKEFNIITNENPNQLLD